MNEGQRGSALWTAVLWAATLVGAAWIGSRIMRDELTQQPSELRRQSSDAVAADRAPDPPPLSIELQARSSEAAGAVERALRAPTARRQAGSRRSR